MTVKILLDILSALPEDCENWPVLMAIDTARLSIGAVAIVPGPGDWPTAGVIRLSQSWPETPPPVAPCDCDDCRRVGS